MRPLIVKISRDGKEIGTYEAIEAGRLRADGTLKGTDFYWHEGMPNWAPMTEFLASESGRKLAEEEALQRKIEKAKEAEAHLAKIKAEQLAYRIGGFIFYFLIVGGIVLLNDDGSGFSQLFRTLHMANSILGIILLMILGCIGIIVAKR
jgi:hypothetical protein